MTSIKENHSLIGKLEEWRAIRPANLYRGQVVAFYNREAPGPNGKFGYGFLISRHVGRFFFCMPEMASVEVSKELAVPKLLFVPQHCLEQPLEEPKVGDYLWYEVREIPEGKKRARPWVHERDYEAAKQELAAI
jgi:hypothetical protein